MLLGGILFWILGSVGNWMLLVVLGALVCIVWWVIVYGIIFFYVVGFWFIVGCVLVR